MPAKISFFDMSIVSAPSGPYVPMPITLGPSWQPNDLRIFCQSAMVGTAGTVTAPPPGFTSMYNNTFWGVDISYRRLVAGDLRRAVQHRGPRPAGMVAFVAMNLGVDRRHEVGPPL